MGKNYIFAHICTYMSIEAVKVKALADISAKNVSFFGRLPYGAANSNHSPQLTD